MREIEITNFVTNTVVEIQPVDGSIDMLVTPVTTSTVLEIAQSGEPGPPGQDGQQGEPGVGVPPGGLTGQILSKTSGDDYDTGWISSSGAIPFLDYNSEDVTLWNNGKGDVETNTSFGDLALKSNISGAYNTIYGYNAVAGNTSGSGISAFGFNAGTYLADGTTLNEDANSNLYLGVSTRSLEANTSNETVIGSNAIGHGTNSMTFGDSEIVSNYFTGDVLANSFVKYGYTGSGLLLDDGNTLNTNTDSTTKYLVAHDGITPRWEALEASGFVPYTGATQDLNMDIHAVIASGVTVTGLTVSTLLATDGANKLTSLSTATYPNFTELSYIKGVTSSIQTQLNLKAPIDNPTFTGTVSGIDKTMVGLGNVDNTSDLSKPISTATQGALDLKEDTANKSTATTLGTSDVLFPTQNAVKTYVDTQVTNATPDASTTVKGKVQLAGDLTGTAAAPTVRGINGVALSGLATGLIKNITSTGAPVIATVRTDYAEPTTALGTGILKNTTGTGAHTIAVAADFPTLNQNTTGTAANVTGTVAIANGGTGATTAGAALTALGAEATANKSTSTSLGSSNTLFPTQNAVKTYVDTQLASKASLTGAETLTNKRIVAGVNAQTGTTYTLVASDFSGWVTANNALSQTYTLPQQSTLATNNGDSTKIININNSFVTLATQGSDVIIGNTIIAPFQSIDIRRTAATTWETFGGSATVNDGFSIPVIKAATANDIAYFTLFAPYAGTILSCSQLSDSLVTAGTYTVSINGVNVTGLTTVTNTVAKTTTTATAANTFALGSTIKVTLSAAVASAVNLSFTLLTSKIL